MLTRAVNIPVGANSTKVAPGVSRTSSPALVAKVVTSPSLGRLQFPKITLPSRNSQAFPVPVTETSGEGYPATSTTLLSVVSTCWITTLSTSERRSIL